MTVRWDPRGLFPSDAAASEAARETFAHGPVFTGTPAQVAARLDELGAFRQRVQRLAAYGAVRFAVAMTDPQANDISAEIDEFAAGADEVFSAFMQEWTQLDEQAAARYLAAPELAVYRRALAVARRDVPAATDSGLDRGLAAREPLADAWADMYELVLSRSNVDQLLAHGRDPDGRIRREAADTLLENLRSNADLLAHCYDTVIADRLVLDAVHGHGGPREERDRANQLDPAVVDGALDAVRSRSDIAHRWYAAKAAALGEDVLHVADIAAPVRDDAQVGYSWQDACDTVVAALDRVDAELAGLAREILSGGRVDAEPRQGKMGSSLCIPAGTATAFILMNFTGTAADVVTLGHEMGHALHFTLSGRAQPGLLNEPSTVLGEVAAIYAELLVFDAMRDPVARADSLVATVFRQTALTTFEQSAYAQRAAGSVLGAERLGRLWTDSMRGLYGSSVAGYAERDCEWALVPHFVRTRFYNYGYTLAALAALGMLRRDPASAAQAYRKLLAAGGSADTQDMLTTLGFDAAAGLDALAELVAVGQDA